MRAVAFEVVVVGVMGAAAAEALVGAGRQPALRRREVVSHLVAARTLNERGAVARADEFDLPTEHADTLRRRALAASIVQVRDGRDDHCSALLEIQRVALEVGWDHDVCTLEAGIHSKSLQQLVALIDVVDLIFQVGHVHPPELDPSPALGGDDPNVALWEGFTQLFFAGEYGG
jgi:hypothetical protein